jgi:hypothetical protein
MFRICFTNAVFFLTHKIIFGISRESKFVFDFVDYKNSVLIYENHNTKN